MKLQLVVVADDGQQVSVDEVIELNKDHERLEHLGLTLARAKASRSVKFRAHRRSKIPAAPIPPPTHILPRRVGPHPHALSRGPPRSLTPSAWPQAL